MTKFQLSVSIVALSAPIFGVRLVNKVPHLVGIFKNQQRGAMRHVPNANCTNFYSILVNFINLFEISVLASNKHFRLGFEIYCEFSEGVLAVSGKRVV